MSSGACSKSWEELLRRQHQAERDARLGAFAAVQLPGTVLGQLHQVHCLLTH